MGRATAALFLFVGLLAGAACGDDEIIGPREPGDVTFDASLGVDLDEMVEVEEGLFFRVLQEGSGDLQAAPSSVATVDVTAWLSDGIQVLGPVDTEITVADEGEPFVGLSRAIVGMRVGEVRQLVIASRLAWGEAGAEGIPPHSVIVMEVELVEIGLP